MVWTGKKNSPFWKKRTAWESAQGNGQLTEKKELSSGNTKEEVQRVDGKKNSTFSKKRLKLIFSAKSIDREQCF